MRFAKALPTAFLTGIKTRKRKRKKEEERKEFFLYLSLCSFDPALFSLYGNGRPPHSALHNQLPSPLERGSFFFLTKMNIQFYIRPFFSYIYLRKKKKKERERERREEGGKKKSKKTFRRENLRADFPTQNLYLFLYAFSFLQINVKHFFRVIFFTLGLL